MLKHSALAISICTVFGFSLPAYAVCSVPNGSYVGAGAGVSNVFNPLSNNNSATTSNAVMAVTFNGTPTTAKNPGTITSGSVLTYLKSVNLPTDPNSTNPPTDPAVTSLHPFAPANGSTTGILFFSNAATFTAQTVNPASITPQAPTTANNFLANNFWLGPCIGILTVTQTSFTFTPTGGTSTTPSNPPVTTTTWVYSVSNSGNVVTIANYANDNNVGGGPIRLEKQ